MSRVFWDTNIFIYLFEDEGENGEQVVAILERMRARGDQLVTSSLTLGEILVKPLRDGATTVASHYENVIQSQAQVIAFNADAARLFAEIRRDRSINAPDAVQLACAATAETDLFITNDERLSRKVIPSIQFIQALANVRI